LTNLSLTLEVVKVISKGAPLNQSDSTTIPCCQTAINSMNVVGRSFNLETVPHWRHKRIGSICPSVQANYQHVIGL